MVVANRDFLILPQGTPLNAADGNPAHKLVIVDGAHQHLERLVHIGLRCRDILENRLKERREVGARHLRRIGSRAVAPGAKEHGAVQLFGRCVQVHEELQHFVHHLVDALIRAVNLVDHHNHPMA